MRLIQQPAQAPMAPVAPRATDIQATVQRAADKAYSEVQAAVNAQNMSADAKNQLKDEIRAAIDAAREATAEAQVPQEGGPVTWSSTAPPDFSNVIPARAVDIVSITGITLVCCVVGFPIARAIGRWIDRRGTTATVPREVTARLMAIEQAVESVAVEVERISEGQRYTTRLLSEGAHNTTPDFLAAGRDPVAVSSVPGNLAGNTPANARRS